MMSTFAARRTIVNAKKYRCARVHARIAARSSASCKSHTTLRNSITNLLMNSDVVTVQYSNDMMAPETANKYRLYSKYTPYLNQRELSLYPDNKTLRQIYEESEGERLKNYLHNIETDVIGCLYDYPECFVLVVGYNANTMTEFFIVQAPF